MRKKKSEDRNLKVRKGILRLLLVMLPVCAIMEVVIGVWLLLTPFRSWSIFALAMAATFAYAREEFLEQQRNLMEAEANSQKEPQEEEKDDP